MLAAILFFALAFICFIGALLLVFHKNPIVASLGMAVSTVTIGVLYIFLHVPFLGYFQMIVYAGAVMVIALYVIMALGREEIGAEIGTGQVLLSYAAALLFIFYVYRLLRKSGFGAFFPVEKTFGTIQSFGDLLVTHYAVPFEIASVLLLGAMIGAIILSRRQWS